MGIKLYLSLLIVYYLNKFFKIQFWLTFFFIGKIIISSDPDDMIGKNFVPSIRILILSLCLSCIANINKLFKFMWICFFDRWYVGKTLVIIWYWGRLLFIMWRFLSTSQSFIGSSTEVSRLKFNSCIQRIYYIFLKLKLRFLLFKCLLRLI